MKRFTKYPAALLLALMMALSLAACGNSGDNATPASTNEEGNTPYELQMQISQEDWDSHRQYVDLATGITMSYVEMGVEDGPALILQHGMTDNSRSWSLVAHFFAEAGYHVYMLDLRGHGYSDKPNTGMYTIIDFSNDIAAFMDAKGIENADLVGHSLGSMTMQAFMMNYPDRCDHVVLVASSPVNSTAVGTDMYDYMLTLNKDEHPDDEFMAGWYTNPNHVDEDFLQREMAESQNLNIDAWRCICAGVAAVDMTPFYPYIDSYDIPTLIMHGTLDSFFDDASQTVLCEYLPDAEYKVYENYGHNLQWEMPEQFAEDVIAFLAA
ncbi:MAG: alpha/beta hydrolase [Clostridiales bacterium]|nr:alpha/beta hydrolase [Clostridiales bacterium]